MCQIRGIIFRIIGKIGNDIIIKTCMLHHNVSSVKEESANIKSSCFNIALLINIVESKIEAVKVGTHDDASMSQTVPLLVGAKQNILAKLNIVLKYGFFSRAVAIIHTICPLSNTITCIEIISDTVSCKDFGTLRPTCHCAVLKSDLITCTLHIVGHISCINSTVCREKHHFAVYIHIEAAVNLIIDSAFGNLFKRSFGRIGRQNIVSLTIAGFNKIECAVKVINLTRVCVIRALNIVRNDVALLANAVIYGLPIKKVG